MGPLKTYPSVPLVTCPTCGTHMRLSAIKPEGRAIMIFECECGFEYQQSSAVTRERQISGL